MKLSILITACLLGSATSLLGEEDESAQATLTYNRDIRPILTKNCFACHGPDSASREADLRIDQPEDAYDREVWIPGSPDESEGLQRILAEDPELVMPPPESHKELTASEVETLRAWIDQGATYEPHWSFIPPTRPTVPSVQASEWVRNPIDAFVLAELERRQLRPAPMADRMTLARRAALDVTGLPPTREMVLAFVQDQSDGAYERYIDRLLDSDRWGEHRARYWLDLARYADTHGIHFDNYREMWSYRDWVIEAFNRNMPYDQFTIENLAGDLLPNANLDQKIASGFNRCNITTNEGGIIDEEYLVLYTRDRIETVSQVWMGLTAGCAVCHDHKFDPLSQREFYEMSAFFNNTTQGARDGNIKDSPPTIIVPRREDRSRWQELATLVPDADRDINQHRNQVRESFESWLSQLHQEEATPADSASDSPVLTLQLDAEADQQSWQQTVDSSTALQLSTNVKWIENPFADDAIQINGLAASLDTFAGFEANQPFSFAAWLRAPKRNQAGAIVAQMDERAAYRGFDFWMQDRRIGTHLISRWPEQGLKVVGKAQIPADRWTHVLVTYDGSQKASGVQVYYDGVQQETLVENDTLAGETRSEVPLKVGQRHLESKLTNLGISNLQIFRTELSERDAANLAIMTALQKHKTDSTSETATDATAPSRKLLTDRIFDWWLTFEDERFQELLAVREGLQRDQAMIRSRSTVAHVMNERQGEPHAFILNRGEYDQRLDRVGAKTPAVLPAFPSSAPKNRLGFAEWLLRPDHPLTSRVTVNRYWQELFGNGIVRTSGDFGITGELPSHPELLDWLAVEFRESGWDVKQLYKLLLTSATYRQSSQTSPTKLEKDSDNRWLSRGPRFRMDAEMVRDYALSSSGLLSDQIGGPSVKPYQPPGVWEAVAMIGSNTRNYQKDDGESLYRRSMYTFWKRSAPPASMETFNAPSREFCTVRRERTNTPLQALNTLNDVQFVEAARHLSERLVATYEDDTSERCVEAFQAIVCRPPREIELKILTQLQTDFVTEFAANPERAKALHEVGDSPHNQQLDSVQVAAMTMVVNTIFNMDEVLNK